MRRIGRRGEGPGELSGGMTLGLLVLPGGRLALPDVGRRSLVVFDSAGTPAGDLPFDVSETALQWRALTGDTVVVLVEGEGATALVRRTLEGGWRDTLATLESPPTGPADDGRWPLLADRVLWTAAASGRMVVARTTRPGLRLHEGGELRRVIRWDAEDRALAPAQVDTLLGMAARSMGDPTGDPRTARAALFPPERLPAAADVEVGPGVVLVQRVRSPGRMDARILSTLGVAGLGGARWDIFAWSGAYLGVLDFGADVEVFRIRADAVVGVREDGMGRVRPFVARLPAALTARAAAATAEVDR